MRKKRMKKDEKKYVLIYVCSVCRKMRLTLSCVLLLPAALHLLLCHAPAASAAAAATRRPLPLPPPVHARHTRHDPLLGLGLLAGFSRHLSLTPQDTPLSTQPLDAMSLALMQRPPADDFTPLGDVLPRTAELPATYDLRDLSDFPLNDFDLLQGILDDREDNSGRQRASTGVREKGLSSCRGYVVSGNAWCPSTLLQVSYNTLGTSELRFLLCSLIHINKSRTRVRNDNKKQKYL